MKYLCCQSGHDLPGYHGTFVMHFGSGLSHRTFCNGGSVVYLHIPLQYPLPTRGYLNLNASSKLKFNKKIQYLRPWLLSP